MRTVIEVKGSSRVHNGDLAPLRALREEHTVKDMIVVCMEDVPRKTQDEIRILPWKVFLEELWADALT
jgi:hypothetical protein